MRFNDFAKIIVLMTKEQWHQLKEVVRKGVQSLKAKEKKNRN